MVLIECSRTMPMKRARSYLPGARSAKRRRAGRVGAYRARGRMNSKVMLRMARRAVLKSCETKYVSNGAENAQLYHNGSTSLGAANYINITNMLALSQGNTQVTRVGDEVWPIGLSIRLWLSNKDNRPNVSYRIYVVAVPSDQIATAPTGFFKGVSGNKMLDYIDTDRYKVVYQKILNPPAGDFSLESSSTLKEHSRLMKIWIPIKGKVTYSTDGGTVPRYQKHILCFGIVAYDAWGTPTTDNLASFAIAYRFYFKDP